MATARVIRAEDQSSFWLLRDHVTPFVTGSDTNDALAVVVSRIHPGDGPPPHIHRNEDEIFYVLDGEMTFLCGESMVVAPAGSFVRGARDVVHCFKCTSASPATMLLIVTPTAFLDFAMTLSQPADDFSKPPTLTPDVIGKLMDVAPQYGIEMKFEHAMPPNVIPAPAAGKRLWVMGEHVSYLATAEQTGGRCTVVEIRSAPGGGPPPHAHTREDEIVYVIAGRHAFEIDGRSEVAGTGDVVFLPHGSRHRYSNVDATPGRLISIHTPGGFEAFFDECGVDAAGHATAPHQPPPPPEAIAALLARHGMTM